jgi:hypothetical protein
MARAKPGRRMFAKPSPSRTERKQTSESLELTAKKPAAPVPFTPSALFVRLAARHDMRAGIETAEVAATHEMSDDESARCAAWLITGPSPQLTAWRRALRGKLKADDLWRTNKRYCSLKGDGIDHLGQRGLGMVDRFDDLDDAEDDPTVHTRFSNTPLGVVLTDSKNRAIGYIAFTLQWCAWARDASDNSLEVHVGEAWISPNRRGEGLGRLMAGVVVDAMTRQIVLFEESWPHCEKSDEWVETPFMLTFAGDVYSKAGEAFLSYCFDEYEEAREYIAEMGRVGLLIEKEAEYDARC